ncbi:MAG: ABC transporter permease [Saprospiraceae bacterium]|nr:ABC transporter permease [Saprospiraceae bacterium]
MIKNYITIAWRNLLRNKSFSIINIVGLAFSMSVCLLIILIIRDQYSYDDFHQNKERIYRIQTRGANGGFLTASSALPLAEKLKAEYPGIEAAFGLNKDMGGDIVYGEEFASGGGYFAGEDFFKVLDFDLIEGNPEKALVAPYSLVVSKKIAEVLFPRESAIGKSVKFNQRGLQASGLEEGNIETDYGNFTITGVMEEPKGKTHLPFEILASQSTMVQLAKDSIIQFAENDWSNVWTNYTYVLLKENQTRQQLDQALADISKRQYTDPESDRYEFMSAPLSSLTPGSFIGNMTSLTLPKPVLMVLLILCLVVMLSACLNYTNLSIAKMLTRSREVGIRKVAGANRGQVFGQFITEAVVIALIALVGAYLLLFFIQNAFTSLWLNQTFLKISLDQDLGAIGIFIGFSVLVGLVAGALPALYVSKMSPLAVFRDLGKIKFMKRLGLRKVLLVLQFTVSLIFIVSVYVLYSQTKKTLNFDYGFTKENVINIKTRKTDYYDRLSNLLTSNKNVISYGGSSIIPAEGVQMSSDFYLIGETTDTIHSNYFDVDQKALDVWDIDLVAGQALPEFSAGNSEKYALVNENLVKDLGYADPKQIIGQIISTEESNVEIRGVVKNFQFLLPNQEAGNLILRNRKDEFTYTTVRLSGINTSEALASLEADWKKANPESRFEYKFMDDQLLFMHNVLYNVTSVIGFISLLAIFISCLGLLGMAAYNAESRTKEIGVRLVLGSSVGQVILLMSKSFMILLGVATVIALPIAYFINNMWLQGFANRVTVSPGIMILGVASMAILSLAMVFSQSYKTAIKNPVDALRND